jgi:hypothetical protein
MGRGPAATNHRDAFVGLYSAEEVSDTGRIYASYLLFGTDGRIFGAKPLWRPDGTFDLEASAAANDYWSGTYRVENDRMLVDWTKFKGDYPVLRTQKGDLGVKMAGASYSPVYPSPWKQLNGRFQSKGSSGLGPLSPGSYGSMQVTVSTWASLTFDFTANGKFKYDQQAIAVATTSVSGSQGPSIVDNSTSSTNLQSEGNYRIDGFFLHLVFADGTSAQDIFVPYDDKNPSVEGFYWGRSYYSKL